MSNDRWEVAVIGRREGRAAPVAWTPDRRLPPELLPLAARLGYAPDEVSEYPVGELTDDLVVGDEVYLRGALVVADEDGLPAALFGRPLVRKSGPSTGPGR